MEGEPDGWAGKSALVAITLSTTIGLYLLMLFLPKIDPKGKLQNMGNKYDQLRFILIIFMSAIVTFIIYYSANGSETGNNFSFIIILTGGLLAFLGNYFQTIKPNYFIGIRTHWTLESEQVWRKTHRLGGRIWLGGGLLIVLLAFVPLPEVKETIMIMIIAVIVVVPIAYSFIEYKKEQRL